MSIKFIQAGLQTSLQDLGRYGYRSYGISQAGAIDPISLQLANWLVDNPANIPCLEVYLTGPEIEFCQNTTLGITGANFEIFINNELVESHQTLFLKKGDYLKFGRLNSGARAYIAFAGTIDTKAFLNSHSTDTTSKLGNNKGYSFTSGDQLELIVSNKKFTYKQIPQNLLINYSSNRVLRVTPGLEYPQLTKASQQTLFTDYFKVSPNSNRMGLRLSENQLFLRSPKDMTSSPITVGTIQLPQDGFPIIIMNEGQTIGGYPRIAQVISADLPLLGQIKPNANIRLFNVSHQHALAILQEKSDYYQTQLTPYSIKI